MSFRKGLQKPVRPPPPKSALSKGSISLSFKQLEEEEEEEEDLSVFTGKYDKILENSHKNQKKPNERTSSTSSVSSTSSQQGEGKPPDKVAGDGEVAGKENAQATVKQASLNTAENTASPRRKTARATLESSKELFSGLKGKITDKISKTIEEFSGESSVTPSPENEVPKPLPDESGSSEAACKEPVAKDLVAKDSFDVHLSKELGFLPDDKLNFLPVANEQTVTVSSSVPTEDHPLAFGGGEDEFEDVAEFLGMNAKKEKENKDEYLVWHDIEPDEDEANKLHFHEHFTRVPLDDSSENAGLSTSTHFKPRSKLKRLIKKAAPKTSAVASMSALNVPSDEEIVASSGKHGFKNDQENPELFPDKPVESNTSTTKTTDSSPPTVLCQLSLDHTSVPYHKLVCLSVAIFAYLVFPLPSYLSGLIMGILLTSFGWSSYLWLMQPPPPAEPFVLPPLEQPPPVPEMKQTVQSDDALYKGWMNELTDYNPEDYHINQTHSVFISLEGTRLRLQRPKNPAPKRAMWDESLTKPQFIHQRHLDLPDSRVFLSPSGLVKKRIWSKKYPICITLASTDSTKDTTDLSKSKVSASTSEFSVESKQKAADLLGFEIISNEKMEDTLYLFARTGREKEEWFKRFSAAASNKPLGNHIVEMKRALSTSPAVHPTNSEGLLKHKREGSSDSVNSLSSHPDASETVPIEGVDLLSFANYMGRLMPTSSSSSASTPTSRASSPTGATSNKLPTKEVDDPVLRAVSPTAAIICDSQLFWINALIGRCFFDFLRDKWWIGKVTEKLQRKLSKIHVPYFIEELQVTDIAMGYEMPAVRHAGKPYMDEKGFWIDLDLTYTGGFKMTIETKMNLMKFKKAQHASSSGGHSVDTLKSPITDSDEEDSAESSTDEEEEAPVNADDSTPSGGGTSKKLLRYLNKITQSKYFQQATEYKVIRRAMENVSNTPLTLGVTVNSLVGKLAVNIPPPPSDRLWYGFRGNPRLRLSAKPQVGERAVTITHVTEWIEKKLALEFQRVFVMPNMDDLVIPILVPGEVNGATLAHSVSL